jgi:transposase-like protein
MARPPEQSNLVDPLEGSDEAKRRLKVVLQTISGERSIAEACERLDISATMLFELRTRALLGALAGISPAAPGRPAEPEEDPQLIALRSLLKQKELELDIERLRTQLALHSALQNKPAANPVKKKQPPPPPA